MNLLRLILRCLVCSGREDGQDLVEYALIILFIVLVVVLVMPTIGSTLADLYNRIPDSLGSGV
jgi:Flp pilus assembly pilin Flp